MPAMSPSTRAASRTQGYRRASFGYPNETGPGAELEHRAEQTADRVLVAGAKPGDRGVIRRLVGADHPERDVLATPPLDRARRAHPDRTRVEQPRDHHRRVMRRAAPPVLAIRPIKRPQIQLLHRREHKPSEKVLRKPLAQRRRQQQHLITVTATEVLRHTQTSRPHRTDPGLRDTLRDVRKR